MTKLTGVFEKEPEPYVHQEYPKWVTPDEKFVKRDPSDPSKSKVTVPGMESFVDRDGNVTVKVDNEDEEAKLAAPKHEEASKHEDHEDAA